ncbi:MAG: hypothetical protein M1825_006488 [Sarcosagium campestre]|nr:MAG: hypothetical protein M1825_006488 [Sarcosagium campestre]
MAFTFGKPKMMTDLGTASTSVTSDISACLLFIGICCLVLAILRRFLPLRTTPVYLLVPVFLALALPTSIVLLVPIDLASSSGSRGLWLPKDVLIVIWRILYWLCFALTWVILPLLGEYVDSGDRSPKGRIKYALRSNARYQLTVIGCCTIGLIYFMLQPGLRVRSFESLKALIMALAYCWGLVLAIYLMGHGLVAIPRRLFRRANIGENLRRVQASAPRVHDKLTDAFQDLEQVEATIVQLRRRKSNLPAEMQDWIEELADTMSLPESRLQTQANASEVPAVLTESYLANFTRTVSRARHRKARFIDAWDSLIKDAVRLQAILDSTASQQLVLGPPSPPFSRGAPLYKRLSPLTPYTRHLTYAYIVPFIQRFCGFIFSVAGACIVWSELVKTGNSRLSVISLTVVHHPGSEAGEVGFAGQVMASAWILYMCAAALTSINDAKVWGNRALVRRNTYGESGCWYASQIAKLTVPLAYNFLTFFPSLYGQTSYFQFLGRLINLSPLGKQFDRFFPVFILVPVCATFFNLYGRVKRFSGFGEMVDDEDDESQSVSGYGIGGWREGRDLIDRELSGHSTYSQSGAVNPSGNQRRIGLPSIANNPSNREPPSLSIPSGRSLDRAASRATSLTSGTSREEPARDAADEDDGFMSEFAHRVRNTFDVTDRPRWMRKLSEGVKIPKWTGSTADSPDESESAGQGGNSGGGLSRWLGGRPSEGRVRL